MRLSARNQLAAAEGRRVTVIVKASDVMIAVDD